MKWYHICFVILLLLIVTGMLLTYSVTKQKSDNNINIYQAVDKCFSKQELKQLENDIFETRISWFGFMLKYHPQCIRTTVQGGYAILLGENDEHFFVFWTEDNRLYATYSSIAFLEKEDFESINIGKSRLEEVFLLDQNAVVIPMSIRTLTGHITKDGVIVIEYDQSNIVKSIDYYSNGDLLHNADEIPFVFIPYILPQDKQ